MIKELNWRRTDLIITTKIFFGTRSGPNDKGLSRKQCVPPPSLCRAPAHGCLRTASSRARRPRSSASSSTTSTCSSRTVPTRPVRLPAPPRVRACAHARHAVPMEEVVRAFNWVIEKGWVRPRRHPLP